MSLSTLQQPSFELIAGHPALDLINTLDWRFRDTGSQELLGSYEDFLRFCVQSGLLSDPQARGLGRAADESARSAALGACRELRESAAEILYAVVEGRSPEESHLSVIEHSLTESRQHQQLRWTGSHLDWEWRSAETDPAWPVWILATSTADLLLSSDLVRLRACEKPDCRWLFLDTSKNHTRRWCDMKICGNRMKARRFKAVHRA